MARCASVSFQYVWFSTVSVAIRIPSSASAPQVGFMSRKTSSIQKERFKSQGHRRIVEVLCSGVPVGFGTILRWL